MRFVPCGETRNRADADRRGFWKAPKIILRQLQLRVLIDSCSSWNVNHQVFAITVIQKLQSELRTVFGSPARTTIASDFLGSFSTNMRPANCGEKQRQNRDDKSAEDRETGGAPSHESNPF